MKEIWKERKRLKDRTPDGGERMEGKGRKGLTDGEENESLIFKHLTRLS